MANHNKPEGPTVLFDLDGTLVDFDLQVAKIFAARYPHMPLLEKRSFYYAEDYPEYAATIRGLIREPEFFSNIPLIDGAVHGIRRAIQAGYTPQICSAPVRNHPTCRQEKLTLVEREFAPIFGSWIVETAIIARDKANYDGIVLIDDWDQTKEQQSATWQHMVFDQVYNQGVQAPFRLRGWHDPNFERMLHAANALRTQAESIS